MEGSCLEQKWEPKDGGCLKSEYLLERSCFKWNWEPKDGGFSKREYQLEGSCLEWNREPKEVSHSEEGVATHWRSLLGAEPGAKGVWLVLDEKLPNDITSSTTESLLTPSIVAMDGKLSG